MAPEETPEVGQLSVNEGIDHLIDTTQDFKNFLKGAVNLTVRTTSEGAIKITDEVNDLLDSVIDKLQGLKG